MGQHNIKITALRKICKERSIIYERAHSHKRNDGSVRVKLYRMRSPDEAGCAALVAQAKLLGADKCGFVKLRDYVWTSDERWVCNEFWSFVATFPMDAVKDKRVEGWLSAPVGVPRVKAAHSNRH